MYAWLVLGIILLICAIAVFWSFVEVVRIAMELSQENTLDVLDIKDRVEDFIIHAGHLILFIVFILCILGSTYGFIRFNKMYNMTQYNTITVKND